MRHNTKTNEVGQFVLKGNEFKTGLETHGTPDQLQKLKILANSLIAEIELLESRISGYKSARTPTPEAGLILQGVEPPRYSDRTLRAFAQAEYQRRRIRERWLPQKHLHEPAWDILLDLYQSASKGNGQRVTSVCIAACVPPTTALRWIKVLESEGLAQREAEVTDLRASSIFLTPEGFRTMSAVLAAMIDKSV